jgi:FlaA1/EpsC-like NDP-sugar epimerase
VTVTHPDAARYFMTVEESVELVVQAASIGRDGEVLVLDIGEPVRIAEVAACTVTASQQIHRRRLHRFASRREAP